MDEAIDSAIEAALTGGSSRTVPSRRDFPRYSASYPILLEIDASGYEALNGVTINVSRSGLLASFREPIAAGSTCRVSFLPADPYRPELVECPHCGSEFPTLEIPDGPISGTVVRLERAEEGAYVAAIMFEEPLTSVAEDQDDESG